MTSLEWKKKYSIGNAAVDHEHREMIRQITTLYQQLEGPVDATTIEAVLGEIHAGISAHFALEERLMRAANYAEYEDHKDDHEDLLDQIHDLMDGFAEDPETGRELLQQRMSDWFGRHFSSFDARLHRELE